MAESGIIAQKFPCRFLDNGAAVRLQHFLYEELVGLADVYPETFKQLVALVGRFALPVFPQQFKGCGRILLPESGKHLLTLAVGGRIPRIGDPAFLSDKAHLPDQP